jgi:hypothetical protein
MVENNQKAWEIVQPFEEYVCRICDQPSEYGGACYELESVCQGCTHTIHLLVDQAHGDVHRMLVSRFCIANVRSRSRSKAATRPRGGECPLRRNPALD